MKQDINDAAGVKFPPPLIFIIIIVLAYGIHRIYPIPICACITGKYIGSALIFSALALIFYISRIFKKHQTNIEPWKSTNAIISSGIYAYSRNPVYLAFCIATVGIGLYIDSLWVVTSFIPSLFLVYLLAVRKEENYLEMKFGEEYKTYRQRVRRWI